MIVVVPVDPPLHGLVLRSLVDATPLSEDEATVLYEAAVTDVCRTVQSSGGELLVNYRDWETIPQRFRGEIGDSSPATSKSTESGTYAGGNNGDAGSAEEMVKDALADGLTEIETVRFERQVGSTRAARVGNTVTHLLTKEEATSVGVLEPTVPLVERTDIDGAAMALRRHDVVLGPAEGGRLFFAGFTEPIDFTDAYEPPEMVTIAHRVSNADLPCGFVGMRPTVSSASGLASTIAGIEASRSAGRPVPEATAAALDALSVTVDADGTIARDPQ